jgi:hypothetical protein
MLFERFSNRFTKFDYPEDMRKIIEYLESIGRLYITYPEIEDHYYRYSDSVCCSWRIVDEDSLKEFADYLENCENEIKVVLD